MKTKLSVKETAVSVVAFAVCYIVLLLVMFAMLAIVAMESVLPYIREHVNGVITVSVAFFIITAVIYIYFFFENKNVLAHVSKIIEIFFLLYLSLVLCTVIGKFIDPIARPLLFCPLMLVMFLRRRDALFINFVFATLLFIFNRYLNNIDQGGSVQMIESISSLLTIFSVGTFGIFLIKNIKNRLGCILITLVLLVPAIVIAIVMRLTVMDEVTLKGMLNIAMYAALNCLFSVFLFMFFLPLFEALFSELTPFRLRELTSDNAKLIKKLKANALGTYNHCVVVAQLAEACASAIGEDAELARAAAFYHDVGKLKNPEMFAENQSDYDLHKELTPELSVDIIRAHARDGAKLIKKYHLPELFADVAIQHHGSLPIKFFYYKALRMSDGSLNVANYSYPGPTPTTKIAAIIMLADASEAATRSLPDRSPEKVESFVKNLVEERMNLDQFVDCNITMRELTIITHTLVTSLTGVYHSRIAYPKLVLSKKK